MTPDPNCAAVGGPKPLPKHLKKRFKKACKILRELHAELISTTVAEDVSYSLSSTRLFLFVYSMQSSNYYEALSSIVDSREENNERQNS